MAAGELVPDELVDRVVREQLEVLSPGQGFVLDGYPRPPREAEFLREILASLGRLDHRPVTVWLDVPREELIRRLRGRRKTEGRVDDVEQAVARRLELHDALAAALRDSLTDWTDVVPIDGAQATDAVTEAIMRQLRSRPDDGVVDMPTGPNTQTE
jgi:adenylate kinase